MTAFSIFAAAAEAPHREALLCDGVRLSFAELALRVQARCAQFDALGVSAAQPQPVALFVDHSLPMFECLYGLLALGIPVLPIHPRLTAPEREQLIELSRARVLLDPTRLDPVAAALALASSPLAIPERRALALVASSGSSGTPKLVELSRAAFRALATADAAHVPPVAGDRALLCLPLSHVGGLSLVTRALAARRCCVVFRASGAGLLGSVPELAQSLIDERISLLSLVPPVLARLLRAEPRIAQRAPLRAVLLGGQACPPPLFEAARERALPVLTSYGLTETCSQLSTLHFPPPRSAPVSQGVVGVGFPLGDSELRIVQGMIEVRGPSLFTRYIGKPSPFDDAGFFATGDRGEFDPELGLFVFGRASELIISGGENVDPTEVEHALLACGGVNAACVFGVPDPEFGQRVAVALELTPEATAAFDERAFFAALDQRLASFKQPRLLCRFEQLPRLGSGKLDRARIRSEAPARLRPADRASRHPAG
jgi:O-succinylbenzoic acid--CoA ligase